MGIYFHSCWVESSEFRLIPWWWKTLERKKKRRVFICHLLARRLLWCSFLLPGKLSPELLSLQEEEERIISLLSLIRNCDLWSEAVNGLGLRVSPSSSFSKLCVLPPSVCFPVGMSVKGGARWGGWLAQLLYSGVKQSAGSPGGDGRGLYFSDLASNILRNPKASLCLPRTETWKLPAGIRREEVTVMQVLRKHGVLSWPPSIPVEQSLPAHFIKRFPSNFFFFVVTLKLFFHSHAAL